MLLLSALMLLIGSESFLPWYYGRKNDGQAYSICDRKRIEVLHAMRKIPM